MVLLKARMVAALVRGKIKLITVVLGVTIVSLALMEIAPGHQPTWLPSDVTDVTSDDTGFNLHKAVVTNTPKKVTKIGFLKVYKAGSTTMQNMFFRFGLKHKLNIIVPTIGSKLKNNSKVMVLKANKTSDSGLFACHTVYNKTRFASFLPVGSVKIGIIREPVARFVSAAYYYRDVWRFRYLRVIPRQNFIHELVQHPERYEFSSKSVFSSTQNSMGRDFGFQDARMSQSDVDEYLQKLNTEFSLVMVTEQFDESLILMRRMLHWSISDVVYLTANANNYTQTVFPDDELTKFKNTSFMDFAIYDFFVKEFEKKLTHVGQDFFDEVKYFKEVLAKVKHYCDVIVPNEAAHVVLTVDKSQWNTGFEVTKSDCLWMRTSEPTFIDLLKQMYTYGNPAYQLE